jgi:hypothetical protein
VLLSPEALLLSAARPSRRTPPPRSPQGVSQQLHGALFGNLAVAALAACFGALNEKLSSLRNTRAENVAHARGARFIHRKLGDRESQGDFGADFVDVLSAGAAGAGKIDASVPVNPSSELRIVHTPGKYGLNGLPLKHISDTFNEMLYEIRNVRQVAGEGFRRWFTDPDHDLVVWYPEQGSRRIEGFQFSYDKQGDEHAITWTTGRGLEHHRIDAGEVPFGNKMSPVLVADGLPDVKRLSERFREISTNIDARIVSFVRQTLESAGA